MWIRRLAGKPACRGLSTVQWNAWQPSTFELARKENKLLFVSSLSHSQWCQIMSNDSFTNPSVAETLNSKYVPVRIQKDEERGIDKALMMFLQLKAKGQGGWPLNVVLTPTKFQPLIAASYLSTEDLTKFLDAGISVWSDAAEKCESVSEDCTNELIAIRDADHGKVAQLDHKDAIEQAALQYKSLASESPRFAMGYALSVIGGDLCKDVLHAMAKGGIVDQLDGGVYTYSISSDWHFPSLQKTLSGQGTMLMACATQLRNEENDEITHELASNIVNYAATLQPWTSASCSSDLWSYDEFCMALKGRLDLKDRDIAQMLWGVNETGNINPDLDPLNKFYGQNVLTKHKCAAEVAQSFGVSESKVESVLRDSLASLRAHKHANKLLPEINKREVLGDLGLLLSGLSQVSPFVPQASLLAHHLASQWQEPQGVQKNDAQSHRTCDDYAFAITGLLDYHDYVDTNNIRTLDAAHRWQNQQIDKFSDEKGGYYYSQNIENLYFRPKYTYDGAEPNYNGVSARNLSRLVQLGYSEYASKVDKSREVGVHGALSSPLAHLSFLHE